MKQMAWVVTVLAAAGCGDDGAKTVDAAIDAPTMCAAKTAPLAPGVHKIYLNFDGITLTKGADNSATNTSDLLVMDSITVPAYVATGNATTRQGRIDLIVDYVQRTLAPYSVDVVTERPAAGSDPYMMCVIGGKPEDFGFPAMVGALAGQKCHPAYGAIALEFELDPNIAAIDYASSILSDISVMVGMGLSDVHNGCANRTGNSIDPGTLCTFSATATTSSMQNCGYTPVQDELELLMDAFGCRD
jgi:hypothetical protein